MRVSSSAAVRSNAGYDARSVEPSSGRVGHAPVDERRAATANAGHTSRTRSHRVITVSNRCGRNSSTCFVRFALMSMPYVAQDTDGVRVQRLRMAAGAGRLDRPGGHVLEQRLGDLRSGAVPRAHEQHAPLAARASGCADDPAARREAQGGVELTAGALQRVTTGDEIDRVVAVAPVGRTTVRGHQATFPQQPQVVGDQVLRFADDHAQLLHGPIAAHELAQQPPSKRVCRQPQERRRAVGWRTGWSGRVHDLTVTDSGRQIK